MTTRIPLSLALCSFLLACGAQTLASPSATTGGQASLSPNGSDDGGGDTPPIDDAGPVDAGQVDAGCPSYSQPTATGCVSEVAITLTGSAFASQGNTLFAGLGLQPELRAFLTLAPDLPFSGVSYEVLQADGGQAMTTFVNQATVDGDGTHYDLPLVTTSLAEGTYSVIAKAEVGAAIFPSNVISVVVDRTPPTLSVSFANDGGVVARDAQLGAVALSNDQGGSGVAQMTVSVAGYSVTSPNHPSVVFPLPVALDDGNGTLNSTLDLSQVAFDAWSTAQDGAAFEATVVAADLAGNTMTQTLSIPATRQLWQSTAWQGTAGLGSVGEIYVNDGTNVEILSPEGALQNAVLLGVGSQMTAGGIPATLASSGNVYLLGHNTLNQATNSAFVSVNPTTGSASIQLVSGVQLNGLALDSATASLYAVDNGCTPYAETANLGAPTTNTFTSDISCARASPMIFDGAFYEATSKGLQVFDFPSLTASGTFSQTAPVISSANQVFAGLASGKPATLNASGLNASALALVSDAAGNVFSIDQSYKLSRTGGFGWSTQLSYGLYPGYPGGIVVGADGLLYVTDGNGVLHVFDETGLLHWQAPGATVMSTLLIDHCTSHAFATNVEGFPFAIAVDSAGVDLGTGSWPMSGHDVFQTYNADATDDVDCTNHW